MFSDREIEFMREEHERDFSGTCKITRGSTQDSTIDPDSLAITESPENELYPEIQCWIQATTRNYERAFDFGEARQNSRTYIIRVPWIVVDLRVNDRVLILTSQDPFAEGRRLKVTDPIFSSEAVSRVIIAEVDQGF